ncbi:MAG TPA: hypothetical protein VFL16_09210 [Steroidobacteraceae bacterium]|nr:hypothetical protein [Steroidobacteraceae bacterium]
MTGKLRVLATPDPAAGRRQGAYVLALMMICGLVFTLPLFRARVDGFPAFLLVSDTAFALLGALLTALLLVRVSALRSASLLLLACGFLFVTLTTLPQLLRMAQGLLPDPRLAFEKQLGLALALVGYALVTRAPAARVLPAAWLGGGVLVTIAVASLCWWIQVDAGSVAPGWDTGARAWAALWLVGAQGLAMLLLWRRRGTALDLWLLVALTAWIVQVLLQSVTPDASGIAWQVARTYALLGAACIAVSLLAESVAESRSAIPRAPLTAGQGVEARTTEGARLDGITERLSQPLCAISANVDAIERLLDRDPPDLAEVRAALADLARDTQRATETLRTAQHLAAEARESPATPRAGATKSGCTG